MAKQKGQPKWAKEPSAERQPRIKESPESADRQTVAWQFHRRDQEHPLWGWSKLGADGFLALLERYFCHLESMTWGEVQAATGGRREGNNNHFVPVSKMPKEAQARLVELRLDDIDDLFSMRLENALRLYGIRDGRVLRLVWHDPHHGTDRGAYPVQR